MAARGKSRRQIEQLLAEWFPRPDAPEKITPLPDPSAGTSPSPEPARSGTGSDTSSEATRSGPGNTAAGSQGRFWLEPLSPGRYRVEFTASAELAAKLERARELLSHALPSGDLAALIERAVDHLLEQETRRRLGSERKLRRKQRPLTPGSRRIPMNVARQVWERDGNQCTFVDERGRRCSARRFLTLEHRQPFALGGPATVDNICLLCKSHNAHAARGVFGEEHIESKRAERETETFIRRNRIEREALHATPLDAAPLHANALHVTALHARPLDARSESGATSPGKQRAEREVYTRVLCGLRSLGFRPKEAEGVLGELKARGVQPIEAQLLREAVSLLAAAR